MSHSPFDFLNAINSTKKDIIVDAATEKSYPAYMVNRGLSYFPDTVQLANEMNVAHHLAGRLQFDFLCQIVRKRKRFSKWLKPETAKNIEAVKEYYGYSNAKAQQALELLTPDQIEVIRQKIFKGGRKAHR
jgi:hypothetical protein